MSHKLPRPQAIRMPNGRKRMLYRNVAGKFISKAAYEKLLAREHRNWKRVHTKAKTNGQAASATDEAAYREPRIIGGPDEDLLDCIDILAQVQSAYPEANPYLTLMQDRFFSYLRRRYELEVIPIEPNKTPFNPHLGHAALDSESKPDYPEGVIVKIVREGYTHNGKVVRDAEVVINQLASNCTELVDVERIRAGRLFVAMKLPPFNTLDNFVDEATYHLRAIDWIYSLLALLEFADVNFLKRVAASLRRQADVGRLSSVATREFLFEASIGPLELVTLKHNERSMYAIFTGEPSLLGMMQDLIAGHRSRVYTSAGASTESDTRPTSHAELVQLQLRQLNNIEAIEEVRRTFAESIVQQLNQMVFTQTLSA